MIAPEPGSLALPRKSKPPVLVEGVRGRRGNEPRRGRHDPYRRFESR